MHRRPQYEMLWAALRTRAAESLNPLSEFIRSKIDGRQD
jgi:hypothetical protein